MSEIKFACPHCQKELPANYAAGWCPFCGRDLEPGQANPASQPAFAPNYGTALKVMAVLILSISGLLMIIGTFRIAAACLPIILAVVVILDVLTSRAFIRKKSVPLQGGAANSTPNEKEYNPVPAFLWLLVGLAPIPILLAVISSRRSNSTWGATVLIACALCNLLGGLGCLGGVKNIGVRIILGIFLAIVFFLLSWIIAAFQACSHSGGI